MSFRPEKSGSHESRMREDATLRLAASTKHGDNSQPQQQLRDHSKAHCLLFHKNYCCYEEASKNRFSRSSCCWCTSDGAIPTETAAL